MASVSVIIPFFNAERHIVETIESIKHQSFSDFEAILVDDGSTDASTSIAKSATLDSRFRYIRQENSGAGSARNRGMKAASGEYLLFLDADDLFDSRMIDLMFESAKASDADVVVCSADSFDTTTNQRLVSKLGPHHSMAPGSYSGPEVRDRLFQIFEGRPWDKLFKAEFVNECGLEFQNLRYSNDTFFVFSALAEASTIVFIDEALVHYRVGTRTSLRDKTAINPFCDLVAFEALRTRFIARSLFTNELLNSFRERCASKVFLTATTLAGSDLDAMRVFLWKYFTAYEPLWQLHLLRYRDVKSNKTLWKYRRFCKCSVDSFLWACRGWKAGRAGYAKTSGSRRLAFGMRLFVASIGKNSMLTAASQKDTHSAFGISEDNYCSQ